MKKIYIPIIATIILALIGFIGASAKEELNKKADNKTIMVYIQGIQAQRVEDRQDDKEEKKEQQKLNEKLMKSIQTMLIKMAKDDK